MPRPANSTWPPQPSTFSRSTGPPSSDERLASPDRPAQAAIQRREPFRDRLFDREIRTIICTTNAIESLNARFRRSVKARGHFPTEQAALKHLYLVILSLDPTGRGRQRWSNRWKAALNAFDMTFDGRLSAGRK
jgi:hypothetical protein